MLVIDASVTEYIPTGPRSQSISLFNESSTTVMTDHYIITVLLNLSARCGVGSNPNVDILRFILSSHDTGCLPANTVRFPK